MSVLAKNKKALFNFELLETYEAGIKLQGWEVKSAKLGHISLKGSFVSLKKGQLYLINTHISPYKKASPYLSYNPTRERKLLLHKREIAKLIGQLQQKGLTLVPIKMYTKHGFVKLEFALAKGKKKADKRAALKERDVKKQMREALRKKT